ncbi:MAG: hypothetical protein A3C50_00175 [Candidatus Staskawiczbacteria bacterium RIFCSPHIGHO2_02_FULL_43_16]|uniref:Uncharacterized protein n=1 Tax=Candidatus Staskawiczbacteria bacterium RIFCSPHIGHO2_01_FULL_41_41 TaxID=1802203 RepID=A0A1G2HVI2_9BACT|nr:MAG: hypothetical protein A2822_01840 [Candidatus Staskawiczbacteria bacterium RIFCSPHIGHO2_01_FULL_41_41]OGZ68910.1 MAG: hypothetical protein A3C50_00175 [Candidatus Staskawiczbacteria bacterium RIFCSPHIGHO2_02_FULL_43_16]OGZ74908.1 MAG: hypothetical protein A3A12_03640 [Candidatus Staskawiczbacteria bacterium RIFCSPLOWO2_01_FULL_43_17b]
MKLLIRLIPLWIILIATLVLTFWSVRQLAVSVIKTTTAPEAASVKMDPYAGGMGMGPGYSNYCLTPPMYPALSSAMMPGTVMTKEDKAAMEKYEKEMQKYNEEYTAACKAEQQKQEKLKERGLNSAWFSSVAVYSILFLFGIFATALTLLVIKKSETEG